LEMADYGSLYEVMEINYLNEQSFSS